MYRWSASERPDKSIHWGLEIEGIRVGAMFFSPTRGEWLGVYNGTAIAHGSRDEVKFALVLNAGSVVARAQDKEFRIKKVREGQAQWRARSMVAG